MTAWFRSSLATRRHSADFRPLPLLGNPHVQTLLSTLLTGTRLAHSARVHLVELPDGDQLALHDSVPTGWRDGEPIALLVHGLGGTHQSPYLQRLAAMMLPEGLRVVRLDLRGCGHGTRLARKAYNGGCSADVRAVTAELHRWSPRSPLYLIGISLGGNIVLKLAGEVAEHPVPGLDRVAAFSPPIDLERCAELIALPRNRLYEQHFVQSLLNQVRQRQRFFPEMPVVRFPRQLGLRDFDELYTAPQGGFATALDYYQRSSSRPLLSHIGVQTLLLTARDDPFIAVEPFETLSVPSHIDVQIIPRGGHVGFLGWDGAGGIRWAERRVADWILQG